MKTHRENIREIITLVNTIEGLYDLGAKWRGVKANTLYLLYAIADEKIHTQKSLQKDWLFPRTTLNTIIKECQANGYISLKPITGAKRELQISLTPAGLDFANQILEPIHVAEEKAIEMTLNECSDQLIKDLQIFTTNLKSSFDHAEIH